jgi:hypothetical protein
MCYKQYVTNTLLVFPQLDRCRRSTNFTVQCEENFETSQRVWSCFEPSACKRMYATVSMSSSGAQNREDLSLPINADRFAVYDMLSVGIPYSRHVIYIGRLTSISSTC